MRGPAEAPGDHSFTARAMLGVTDSGWTSTAGIYEPLGAANSSSPILGQGAPIGSICL